MKKLFLIPLAFSLSFCNCVKNVNPKASLYVIESSCPDDGACTIQIVKNKSLVIKKDGLGSIYYELRDDINTSVIHYQYNRNVEEGLQDGQHREEIIFEIDNSSTKINLKDQKLQEAKMLFGRHCFCKGQAGFFKIEEGLLKMESKKNTVYLDLEFKVNQVPQLFEKVKATINLK